MYLKIQETLIQELNEAKFIKVKGKDGNQTDIMVSMQEITDKEKHTNFENCLADVNIPVGEVFTSPKLEGTKGILNVSEVYLNELKFVNLKLDLRLFMFFVQKIMEKWISNCQMNLKMQSQ